MHIDSLQYARFLGSEYHIGAVGTEVKDLKISQVTVLDEAGMGPIHIPLLSWDPLTPFRTLNLESDMNLT
jgi:hypothetical protein